MLAHDIAIPDKIRAQLRTAGELAVSRHSPAGASGRGRLPAPWDGLPACERGRTYACTGDAPLSLLFGLVADATRHGSWFAMVDMPHAGLMAAHEHGVALQRTLCVDTGACNDAARTWGRVVGALVDGVDIVAAASPACSAAEARRVSARVKASGAVLFLVGSSGSFEVDAEFRAHTASWQFDVQARSRSVRVALSGRRVQGSPSCLVRFPADPSVP